MNVYTYTIGELVTVESEFEIFLFDVPQRNRVSSPDVVVRGTDCEKIAAEWTGEQVRIMVPPSVPTEKTNSSEPIEFTKAIMSAIERTLLRRGATLAFGAALRTPEGIGVGIFGDSGCGKSTAAFRLTRRRQYQLLADDLLVCHGGTIYPFPRYVNLPRDVPVVEAWVQSASLPSDRSRQWDDEVDVPRALVSDVVPDQVDLDQVVLLDDVGSPVDEKATPETEKVSTESASAALTEWKRANLAGWTSHPRIRDGVENSDPDQRELISEAIAGADCYRITSPKGIPRSIADLVEPKPRERQLTSGGK